MVDAFFRVLALTRKELLQIFKDPRSRYSLLIPPILQCLIYGYVATYDLNDVPYAVLDQDHSAASQKFLAALDGSGVFRRVANLNRSVDVKTTINERRALLVVQIQPDFERRLLSGRQADVQVIADGRNSNTAGTAMGYTGEIVESFNASWRKERTFDQLLVTPFRPVEIMAGKALPAIFVGIVQATMVLLVAQLWFRIPFAGSFITLYAGLIVFLLAAVGMGLLLSSVAATMQQAMLFSFLLMMPFALLSGLTTPVSSMPTALQYATLINPLRYAIDMAHRVYLEGVGLDLLFPELWPLAIIAFATLSGASWMFRHRLT